MKAKVYLIRALLIFLAFVLYSLIITSLKTVGILLGGIPTAILFALFLYFIYAVAKGKIGPKLPESSNQDAPIGQNGEFFHCCPHCGAPNAESAYFCRCGCSLPYDLPLYRRCPACGTSVPCNQPACDCGHNFDSADINPR